MVEQFGKDIVITYKGADRLEAFKKDVREVRNVLNGLVAKASEMSKVSAELKKLTATTLVESHKEALRISQKEVQALREQLQLTKTLTGEEAARDRARSARQTRIFNAKKQGLQISRLEKQIQREQIAGLNKLADREARLAAQKKKFAAAQKRAQEDAIQRTKRGTAASTQQVGAIQAAIGRTIRFFVLFRAVQEGIQLAGKSITKSLDFAALLEESQVQIAGLIVSVSELTDEFGNTLNAAEAMPVALSLSKDILSQLQKDAVLTASTFQDLVKNLQVAVAPGVSNGLDLDQVRQLTVTFSQAATALGLEQRQLSEEIRSTLQGTITARNTRIATSLGITNEDVRQAKEAGQLFEFLEERMAGIAGAATLLQGSLSLLRSNFFDLLQIAGATGIQPVFKELKGLFGDLIDLFDEGTLQDGVQIEPGVIDTMQLAAEGMAAIVESFREFIKTEEAGETLNAVARALNELGGDVAQALPGLLSAIASAIQALSVIAANGAELLSLIPPGLIAIGTAIITILPLFKALAVLIGGAATSAAAAAGTFGTWGLALAPLLPLLPLIAASALAAIIIFGDFGEEMSETARRTEEITEAQEEFVAIQDRVAAAAVSVTGKLVAQSKAFEDLAEKIKKAVTTQEQRSQTPIEIFRLEELETIESARREAITRRTAAEKAYNDAVKSSQVTLEGVSDSIRRVALAQRERDASASAVRAGQGTDGGPSEGTIDRLRAANLEYQNALSDAASERRRFAIEELAELKRVEIFKRAAEIRSGGRPITALDRELKTDQGLEEATRITRLQLEAAEELKTTNVELRSEVSAQAEEAATALAERDKALGSIRASEQGVLEAKEQQLDVDRQLGALVGGRARDVSSESNTATEKLQRRLKLQQDLNALEENSPAIDQLKTQAALAEKRIPLLVKNVELTNLFNLALSLGGDEQAEALVAIQEARRAIDEQLAAMEALSAEDQKRLDIVRERADIEAGIALDALELQLSVSKELTALSTQSGQGRAGADIQSLLATSAGERRDAARKTLEIETRISQRSLSDLETERALLEIKRDSQIDLEKALKTGLKIEEVNRNIVEEVNNGRLLKAETLQLERQIREETQLRAGFAKGLQDAASQRGLGSEFQQVGLTFADSFGDGIREVLTGGDTQDAINLFASTMESAILDALINALVVAPVSEFLSGVLGGGKTAEETAALAAAASLTSLSFAANLAAASLISVATAGAASSFTTGFIPGTPFPFALPITGNAEGGSIPAPNMPKSLPGHHAGDTTLIAAQQGEFMFNKSVSSQLGHAFLNSINSGMLSGSQARAAIASRIHRNSAPIRGFDLGGSVGPTAAEGVSQSGGGRRRNRGGRSVLLPVTNDSANTILSNPMLGPNLAANKAALGLSDREYI